MSICIVQINHCNERLNAIVNVWIELCQESNHFKIFIMIVEFWKSVHSRNGSEMISEQLETSLWHRRADFILRIHDEHECDNITRINNRWRKTNLDQISLFLFREKLRTLYQIIHSRDLQSIMSTSRIYKMSISNNDQLRQV